MKITLDFYPDGVELDVGIGGETLTKNKIDDLVETLRMVQKWQERRKEKRKIDSKLS